MRKIVPRAERFFAVWAALYARPKRRNQANVELMFKKVSSLSITDFAADSPSLKRQAPI
jgi:hypothetical protein